MGQIFLRVTVVFPVRINLPMLHIHLHLHVDLSKRRNGRSLPTNQKAFAGIGEHWREVLFLFYVFKAVP
jgi:hypothetical protein